MFWVNPLPGRGFTWNIKSYFLWKTMKKYLWMSSAAVVISALRVKWIGMSLWPRKTHKHYRKVLVIIPAGPWSRSKKPLLKVNNGKYNVKIFALNWSFYCPQMINVSKYEIDQIKLKIIQVFQYKFNFHKPSTIINLYWNVNKNTFDHYKIHLGRSNYGCGQN